MDKEGLGQDKFYSEEADKIAHTPIEQPEFDRKIRTQQLNLEAGNKIAKLVYQALDGHLDNREFLAGVKALTEQYPELGESAINELVEKRLESGDERIHDPDEASAFAAATKKDMDRLEELKTAPLEAFHSESNPESTFAQHAEDIQATITNASELFSLSDKINDTEVDANDTAKDQELADAKRELKRYKEVVQALSGYKYSPHFSREQVTEFDEHPEKQKQLLQHFQDQVMLMELEVAKKRRAQARE